jgi:hypothetical protein
MHFGNVMRNLNGIHELFAIGKLFATNGRVGADLPIIVQSKKEGRGKILKPAEVEWHLVYAKPFLRQRLRSSFRESFIAGYGLAARLIFRGS